MDGFISKIQRYSTKDGPGIRTTVFAVGCNLSCKWCSNPELIGAGPKILYHAERCVRCGACAALSGGAIKLGDGGCVIDRENCANLNECAAACFYDAYERIGMNVGAEDLAARLLRDGAFYARSGGGVTFSGGEPALEAAFFLELGGLLKAKGVHVALDTAGAVPWETLGPLVDAVDLVLYDIKAFNNELHKQLTGEGNRLILENARKIAETKKPMHVRMLLVPGVNDSDEETENRLAFIRELGAARLDILKYHRLGEGKYPALGLGEPMAGTPEASDEMANRVLQKALSMGLTAAIS